MKAWLYFLSSVFLMGIVAAFPVEGQGQTTIGPIIDPAPLRDVDGVQYLNFDGIEGQGALSLVASSSHPSVINPSAWHQGLPGMATVIFDPAPDNLGTAIVTVALTDDRQTLGYVSDDTWATESFMVRVLDTKPCDGRPCRVYSGHRDHGSIDVIDAGTNAIIDTISVNLLRVYQLAMTPDGAKIYARGPTGGAARLSVVDVALGTEIGTIPLPDDSSSLAMSPDGTRLYATVPGDDLVVVIDTASDAVVQSVEIGGAGHPNAMVHSRIASELYIAMSGGELLVLDTESATIGARIPIHAGPHRLAVDGFNERLYVSNRDNDTVSIIGLRNYVFAGDIPVANYPDGLALSPDGRKLYVAAFGTAFRGRLDVIDAFNSVRTGTIMLKGLNGPHSIGITPDGTRAYVTTEAGRDVAVVSLAKGEIVAKVSIGTPTMGVTVSGLPSLYRMLGDLNRDRRVDLDDLFMLAQDMGYTVNQSEYGLSCDLDADGIITIFDSQLLSALCTEVDCATPASASTEN